MVNKPKNYHIDGAYDETVEKFILQLTGTLPKLVHQLDYPTSGVMILALSRKAAGLAAA